MSARPGRLALKGATVSYGNVRAVDAVDLQIEPGEAVALVGPSGAGKTTLLRLLGATLTPSAGSVRVDDADPAALAGTALRRIRSRIGFIYQDLRLVPSVRVVRNVLMGRLGQLGFLRASAQLAFPGKQTVRDVHALLERVGIGEKLYERTDRLSGGQRQRVAIARALYQQPHAMLADEPVSSVDPARARDTIALLTRLAREEGSTLVCSIHNLVLAREFFPRLVGLRDGRVVFDRAASTLTDQDFETLYELRREELLRDLRA